MAANVFRVIIPSQKNIVDDALANEKPDLQKGISAKNRSIHNNYITCLLYTSPSPRDLSTSRMPSSA